MGNRIRVQKVPSQATKLEKREMYALVCYHYPQYTLKAAARLPFRDIQLLLTTAKKQEGNRLYNYVQIAAAPHTKKMQGVKKLSEHFKKMAGN